MKIARTIVAVLSAVAGIASAQLTYQWTDITPPGGQVRNAGIHPLDGRIIVLGTFTVQGSSVSVMYSNDRGSTWNAPSTPAPYSSWMYVHPGQPGVVFAGTAGGLGSVRFGTVTTKGQLYRSDDFGRTWSSVFTAGDGESIQVIGADPLNAHAAYAFRIPGQTCTAGFGCIYARSWEIVYTRNDGVDWTSVSTLLGDRITTYSNPIGPTPADPARLFASRGFSDVLVSRDSGATWSPFFAPSLPGPFVAVVPDPTRANVLYGYVHYVENNSRNRNLTVRSDDAGATWREIFNSERAGGWPIVDPLHPRTLWLGSPEYVNGSGYLFYRSDDAGDTWQTVSCPGPTDATASCPRTVFLSTAEPGIVYLVGNNQLLRGTPSSVPDPVVAEFHYEADRYWSAVSAGGAFSQDYRQEPGHVWRTGLKWGAWRADDAPAGAVGSCRFWPQPSIGRSRVIVQQGADCDALKRDPGWILEAENEFFTMRPVNNACPANTVPVRRFLNLQPDFNHRWVADPSLFDQMRITRGWYDEGVRFCARLLGANE
jgi:hypothetical protein